MGRMRISDDGLSVVIEDFDKRYAIAIPFGAAKEIGKEILRIASVCEERANAAGIAKDQAILIRKNFPVGLTRNREIIKESLKQSEYLKIPGTTVDSLNSVPLLPTLKQG